MESSCRIMILDDEFIMRQGIRFMLKWEEDGYEIVGEASNGREALELIPELKPHIILCDIAMPVMNGLDFIKVAGREYPDIRIIVLSSYDNFEYVREALLNGAADYVLKPTLNSGELLNILSKTVQKIPDLQLRKKAFSSLETALERYLTGYEEKLGEQILKALPYSCCRMFVLPLRCRDAYGVDLSAVLYEKMEEFLNHIQYCRHLKFLFRKEILCVVLSYEVRDEKKVTEALEIFMEQLGLISEQALGTLGACHRKPWEIKKDFQIPGFLETESFYHKGVHLYRIETAEERNGEQEKFDFRKFAAAIAAHKYQEAIELFRAYIYNSIKSEMPGFKLKNQTKNLLYNLIGDTQEHVQELEEICRNAFETIEQAYYCEDFLEAYEEILCKLARVFKTEKENQNAYLEKILEYIREHYMEELNLQNLAEEFHLSYSYLSAYFSQNVHEGFSEYLNRVRIQKACEFLEDSRCSIAQVSAVVGYSDHSYFCRVFKKITGRTPSEFRREIR